MTGIPWLAEIKEDSETLTHARLLALIRVVEEAQKYTAPEFRNLIDAVDAARGVP